MKLPPKPNKPPLMKSIYCICEKFINLLMLLAKRQDQHFMALLKIERHLHKIDAGFVVTSFHQAALEKVETHAMIEDINDLIEQFKLHESRDQPTPE